MDVPAHDAERTARFWRGATGANLTHLYTDAQEYVGADLPYAEHFTFLVQELGEGEPGSIWTSTPMMWKRKSRA